jgi:hypothetical protein
MEKIVFVAKFKEVWDEEPIAQAFERAGVQVIRLEEKTTAEKILKTALAEKPDLVLFTKMRIIGDPWQLLADLKGAGIKTASWTFDLLLGHPPRQAIIKSFPFLFCDYVFLTDGGHEAEYRALGVNKFTVRQGLPKEYSYLAEPDPKYDYELVFLGSPNPSFPYRQRTMQFLEERYGEKFKWLGKENTYEVRGDELNKLYASAKIIIGDSMYSPHYWSNRIYETLGRGAFLIHPLIEGLEQEFTPYKHFIPYTWNDYEGLAEKIDFYLDNQALREKIRKAAFKFVQDHYLFDHRVQELISLYETHS